MHIKIGNAQGFWGDSATAPAKLISQQRDLDYLTLDYLAEVSMSILATQKEKDPAAGFAKDFIDVVQSMIPFWQQGLKFKIVTNAGGLNPFGCAQACQLILQNHQCPKRIAIVSGDHVLETLKGRPEYPLYDHLDKGESFQTIQDSAATANAYLGAEPISQALLQEADIVITGRVADPSLTVGPCLAHFGWRRDAYDQIAGATIAGHLIECGTQVTGGISTNWMQLPNTSSIGFPFVEMQADGTFVITKPLNTGGRVSIDTVKEQLLYEIGDPSRYLSPDATVSFLSLVLEEKGIDCIRVSGALGKAPPNTYKVSATYRDGYRTEGLLAIFGRDAKAKGLKTGELILQRVKDAGYELKKTRIECIGAGAIVPNVFRDDFYSPNFECLLRISAQDPRREALDCFAKEIAGMVTSGPQAITGYLSGRPHIRPVFGYWPCLIERHEVNPMVQMLP